MKNNRDDDLPFSENGIDFLKILQENGITNCHLAKATKDPRIIKKIIKILFERSNDINKLNNNLSGIMPRFSVFGPKDWRRHYGHKFCFYTKFPIDLEELRNIVEGDCPFSQNKKLKIKETHFLYFLPQNIEGQGLTIEKWHQLHSEENKIRFYNYKNAWYTGEDFIRNIIPSGEWFLMYKGVIPDSMERTLEYQLKMLPSNYEIPSACEVIPMHFFTYLKNKEYINKNIYGRVRDVIPNFRICVGRLNCNSINIVIHGDNVPAQNIGIFASRKLIL